MPPAATTAPEAAPAVAEPGAALIYTTAPKADKDEKKTPDEGGAVGTATTIASVLQTLGVGSDNLNMTTGGTGNSAVRSFNPPSFPNQINLEQWDVAMCRKLVAASRCNDQAEVAWFNEVKTKTFEELGSRPLFSLSLFFSASLSSSLSYHLPRLVVHQPYPSISSALSLLQVLRSWQCTRDLNVTMKTCRES